MPSDTAAYTSSVLLIIINT